MIIKMKSGAPRFPSWADGARQQLARFLLVFILASFAQSVAAVEDAKSIVNDAIQYWRDTSSDARVQMVIHRPDWERKLEFRSITQGEKKALVRVFAPKKDAGSATLLLDRVMWSFTPQVNRVIQIPSSMMQQNWMGSDYANGDVAKSDRIIDDYKHVLIGQEKNEGQIVRVIESTPSADAAVVWGKEILRIRADKVLLGHEYYDQDGKLMKRMISLEVKLMGGKPTVTVQRMEDLTKSDSWTEIRLVSIAYGVHFPDGYFLPANLRNPGL